MNFFYTRNMSDFSEYYFLHKNEDKERNMLIKLAQKNKIQVDKIYADFYLKSEPVSCHRIQWNDMLKEIEVAAEREECCIYMQSWDYLSPDPEHFIKSYIELYQKNIFICFFDNFTLNTTYIKELYEKLQENNLNVTYNLKELLYMQLHNEHLRTRYEHDKLSRRIKEGKKNSNKPANISHGPRLLTDSLKLDIYKFICSDEKNISSFVRNHNISRPTFIRYLKYVESELEHQELKEWYLSNT